MEAAAGRSVEPSPGMSIDQILTQSGGGANPIALRSPLTVDWVQSDGRANPIALRSPLTVDWVQSDGRANPIALRSPLTVDWVGRNLQSIFLV